MNTRAGSIRTADVDGELDPPLVLVTLPVEAPVDPEQAYPAATVVGPTDQIYVLQEGVLKLATGTVLFTGYQVTNAQLTAIKDLATTGIVERTGPNVFATFDITATGKSLVGGENATAMRTTLGLGTSAVLSVPASGDAAAGEVVKGNDTRLSDTRTPSAHTHPHTAITGLGTAAVANLPAPTFNASSSQVVRGDDSRLSGARTPLAHADSHFTGGGDAITAADIGAASAGHTHTIANIPLLQQALDGKASYGTATILKPDGTSQLHPALVDTDAARGAALVAAMAVLVAGEVLLLSPGTFALSADLTIDVAIAIRGAGSGKTIITCSGAFKITLDAEDVTLADLTVSRSGSNAGMVLTCNVTSMATIKDGIVLRDVEVENAAGMACGTLHGDAYGCRFYGMTAIDWLYGGRLHDCEIEAHDPLLVTTTYGIKTAQSIADFGGPVAYKADETDRRRRSLVSGGRIVNTDPDGIGINGVAEDPDGDRTTKDWFLAGGVPQVSWYPVPVIGVYIHAPQPRVGAGPNNLGVIVRAGGTGAALRGTLNITSCEVYGFYQASYLHDSNITGGIWISEDEDYQVMNNVEACTFLGVHFIYGNTRLGTSDGLRRMQLNVGNVFHQCHFQGQTESILEGYQLQTTQCTEYGFDGVRGVFGFDQKKKLAVRCNGVAAQQLWTATTTAFSLAAVTFEVWFRCENVGSDARLLAYEDMGGSNFSHITIQPSTGTIYAHVGGISLVSAAGQGFTDGAWHHAAITNNGGTGTLWLDGVSMATAGGVVMAGTSRLRIGHASGNVSCFTGDLTELRVSNSARYTGAFTPATHFLPDANTLVLYSDSTRDALTWTDQMGVLDAASIADHQSAPNVPFWVLRDRAYDPN